MKYDKEVFALSCIHTSLTGKCGIDTETNRPLNQRSQRFMLMGSWITKYSYLNRDIYKNKPNYSEICHRVNQDSCWAYKCGN